MNVHGSLVTQIDMLEGETAPVTGTPKAVGTAKTLRIEVWGSGTFAVQIEGIGKSGTPRALPVWDNIKNTFVGGGSITAAGFYDIDVQTYDEVQAHATAVSGGDVNVSGGLVY